MTKLENVGIWSLLLVVSMLGINRIYAILEGKDQVLSILAVIACIIDSWLLLDLLFPNKKI